MSVIGQRLKNVREGKGLSLRKFADELDEHFTLLSHIEAGRRYPSKGNLEKFAKALSLTPNQLDALIAVERRGLDPHELLPEIPPAHISYTSIEQAAESGLAKYRRSKGMPIELPVRVDETLAAGWGLATRYCDFKKKEIPGAGNLSGC